MNEIVELRIDSLAFGGAGVARWRGEVVFVAGVVPGERIRARIWDQRKSFCRARLMEVLEAAPDRIEPVCPFAVIPWSRPWAISPFCAGCSYQHLRYGAEVAAKQRQGTEVLVQAGMGSVPLAVEAADPPIGYRNKGVLHAAVEDGDCRLGYVQEDNRSILDIPACPLWHPDLNGCLAELRAKPGSLRGFRDQGRLTLRHTARDGAVWWRGSPKTSDPWLHESTGLGELLVPRNAFFQVHPRMGGRLCEWVRDRIRDRPGEWVADLYCGVGVFGLLAAREGRRVVGIESHGQAIEAAVINADRLGLDRSRVRWITGDAAHVWPEVSAGENPEAGMVVVDPPRTGLDPRLIEHLTARPVGTVLYISCGPDTLGRDLKGLAAGGYAVRSAMLMDLFPRTPHFEMVVELVRRTAS